DDAGLSLVIRRVLRVGPNAGTPLEDYGVVSNERHAVTRNDITNDDADLMAAAAGLLAKGSPRRFDVGLSEAGGGVTATLGGLAGTCGVPGIDRADVIVDGRPRLTVDLGGNPGPVPVPGAGAPGMVRIAGYEQGVLVAARTFIRKGADLQLRATLDDQF